MTNFTLHAGNNIDVMRTFEDNSFDAIITDPPYGIDFLGKEWDANTGALETYQECLRVLKPGGYLLAFSAARTYHHLAITLEQAGFEIRDQLMWLYASGFPKAQDIGKAIDKRNGINESFTYVKNNIDSRNVKNTGNHTTPYCKECDANMTYSPSQCDRMCNAKKPPIQSEWEGWKTALKPAHEPICMARKPFKGSTIDNVLEHGVGALNIDATRIESETLTYPGNGMNRLEFNQNEPNKWEGETVTNDQGRFPSNVIGEVEGYQKYFYCPKVSRKERHIGFEAPPPQPFNSPEEMKKHPLWDPSIGTNSHRLMKKIREHQAKDLGILTTEQMVEAMGGKLVAQNIIWTPDLGEFYIHGLKEEYIKWCKKNNKETGSMGNNHPTVKPVALMRYLIKLVTPANSRVLDPFNGSGSTGMAATELGHEYVGIDLDPNYIEIARRRIEAWNEPETELVARFNELFEVESHTPEPPTYENTIIGVTHAG